MVWRRIIRKSTINTEKNNGAFPIKAGTEQRRQSTGMMNPTRASSLVGLRRSLVLMQPNRNAACGGGGDDGRTTSTGSSIGDMSTSTSDTTKSSSSCCGSSIPEPHEIMSVLKVKTLEESLKNSRSSSHRTNAEDEEGCNYSGRSSTIITTPTTCCEETSVEIPPPKKQICFSTVTVHYFNTILSENPAVSMGPPLGLGHECRYQDVYDSIEEAQRHEVITSWRRPGNAEDAQKHRLMIPAQVRERMLRQAGVPAKEIQTCLMYQRLQMRQKQLMANNNYAVY